MIRFFTIALLLPLFLHCADNDQNEKKLTTIVPKDRWISDFEARFSLARILSHHKETREAALVQYETLLQEKPESIKLNIELARLYITMRRFREGLDRLYQTLEKHPENLKLLVACAQAEAEIGHAAKSQDLFLKALCLSGNRPSILMKYADAMMSWGDFYAAEKIYREALGRHHNSLKIALKLAWTLASSQRYEEAEGIYQKLLIDRPCNPKVLEALANLKVLQKDFAEALGYIDQLIAIDPIEPLYLSMKAEVLFSSECFENSLTIYELLRNDPNYAFKAYIGIGKASLRLRQTAEAAEAFQKAYEIDPESLEAKFYLMQLLSCGEDLDQFDFSPHDLTEWAFLSLENGLSGLALDAYTRALELDPDFFPAKIGRAEMLSISFRFDESIDIYCCLLQTFSNNSKILLSLARVFAWGKYYQEALNYYDELIKLNPEDPLPYREKAWTAYWAKMFRVSMSIYDELLFPLVDELLLKALKDFACKGSAVTEFLPDLEVALAEGSIFQGYEAFASHFEAAKASYSSFERLSIQHLLADLLPKYLIQRKAALEKQVKKLLWSRRYLHALDYYPSLLADNPGDESFLFEAGQTFCDIHLCGSANRLYYDILNIDPNHTLAKMALRINQINMHLGLRDYCSYWREIGTGTFSQSQIARYRNDLIIEKPLTCNSHIRLIQHAWVENPFNNFRFYPAEGQSIEADYVFNEYFRGFSSITYKNYFNRFRSRVTSRNNLFVNLNDYARVSLGLDKENEIYNFFSLKQAIQSLSTWALISSDITHYWNLEGLIRHYQYNDHNQQIHLNLTSRYAFTDDPRVFQLILSGNYRNTAHDSISIVAGNTLVDVIHPYWTPIDYYSGSITLQLRKDYRDIEACELPQRYVDLKLTGETDNQDNPGVQVALEWRYDWDYYGFELKGLVHRSRQWNAEGFWGTFSYRF